MGASGDVTVEAIVPAKLDTDSATQRVHMLAPASLLKRLDAWRRQQDPIPNVSAAIRRLVEIGLEAEEKKRGRP